MTVTSLQAHLSEVAESNIYDKLIYAKTLADCKNHNTARSGMQLFCEIGSAYNRDSEEFGRTELYFCSRYYDPKFKLFAKEGLDQEKLSNFLSFRKGYRERQLEQYLSEGEIQNLKPHEDAMSDMIPENQAIYIQSLLVGLDIDPEPVVATHLLFGLVQEGYDPPIEALFRMLIAKDSAPDGVKDFLNKTEDSIFKSVFTLGSSNAYPRTMEAFDNLGRGHVRQRAVEVAARFVA